MSSLTLSDTLSHSPAESDHGPFHSTSLPLCKKVSQSIVIEPSPKQPDEPGISHANEFDVTILVIDQRNFCNCVGFKKIPLKNENFRFLLLNKLPCPFTRPLYKRTSRPLGSGSMYAAFSDLKRLAFFNISHISFFLDSVCRSLIGKLSSMPPLQRQKSLKNARQFQQKKDGKRLTSNRRDHRMSFLHQDFRMNQTLLHKLFQLVLPKIHSVHSCSCKTPRNLRLSKQATDRRQLICFISFSNSTVFE
jgi:hypothetical protein